MEALGIGATWLCSRCKAVYSEVRERCPADGRRLIPNLRGHVFGGRWVVDRLLGVGGDGGSVWQASTSQHQRNVALKVLPTTDQTAAQRFERGARISGMLEHRHITGVIEHGREGDWFFLVMELLEGETLQRYLARQSRLSSVESATMADQMLQALEYAHAMGVIHRDLKPANVFVTSGADGRTFAKLLDFGIAKQIAAEDSARASSALASPDAPLDRDSEDGERLHITQQNQILGTPEYMAPEQILGARLDARADIYSLGVVLYRMLAGRLPFEAKTRVEMYKRHLYEPPPPFAPDSGVSLELEKVVLRALAKNVDERWSSATEMRKAVVAARSTLALTPTARNQRPVATEIDPTPTGASMQAGLPAQKRSRKRAVLWGGGVAALLISGLVVVAGSGKSEALPEKRAGGAGAATVEQASAATPVTAQAPTAATPASAGSAAAPEGGAAAPAGGAKAARPEEPIEAKVEPADARAEAPEVAPARTSFKLSTGAIKAEVVRDEKVLGTTPFDLEVLESELPVEVTIKAAGFRPTTQRLGADQAGREVDVKLSRWPAARPASSEPKKPSGNINLER